MGAATIRRFHEEQARKGKGQPAPKPTADVPRRDHDHAMADQRIELGTRILELEKQVAELGDGGLAVDVNVLDIPEVAEKLDEAAQLLSDAADANEALTKQVAELEALLEEATAADANEAPEQDAGEQVAETQPEPPVDDKPPKPSGKGGSKSKGK